MSNLQWHYAGARGDNYFADHSKCEPKYEAQASWSTPHGPGRYRIWRRGFYYDVVRLRPSTSTWKFDGRPLNFSGRQLATMLSSMNEAKAIAEADNTRLHAERLIAHKSYGERDP